MDERTMVDRQAVDGHAATQARARVAQAAGELDRLEHEIAAWVGARRDRDRSRQYATPLATLERTLLGAVRALREEVEAAAPGESLGAVYSHCKRTGQQAAIVRQVWAWFRARFDQRDDATLSGLLAAADEVVWSCYQEAFASAELTFAPVAPRGPTPLPYVAEGAAAEAFVRDRPPHGLAAGEHQEAIQRCLRQLPVPAIGLPASCLDAPWWLALVGHEVGHHLQHELIADAALVREIGDAVEQAVGGSDADVARWRSWGEEIFADACAVVAVGAGAVTAVLQLELDTEERMLVRRPGYPPAAVRLALLAELADQLGLDGRAALDGFDPGALVAQRDGDAPAPAAWRAGARDDLAQTGRVASAVLAAPLGGAGPLTRLFRFRDKDHRPGGRVANWSDSIRQGTARPEQTLRAPRDQIGAAVHAWHHAVRIPDDTERSHALASLASTLLPLVAASREPGARAGMRERGPQDLSADLLEALHTAVPGDQAEE